MKTHFNFILILSAIIFLSLLSSCEKEESTTPQLKGTLIGWATLNDEFANRISDKSGVIVTVDGTNPLLTATTDSTGKYQIDNLPEGTYNLICTKSGFATYKVIGLQVVGGNMPRVQNISLTQPSTTVISNISVKDSSNKISYMQYSVATNAASGTIFDIRYFISTSDSVSSINYQYTGAVGIRFSANMVQQFAVATINNIFPSGTLVYVIAYGETSTDATYTDITTGLTIYPALNSQASNIASFIVP
jgi:3D (Asp-Asp-Asp) domain-containing protein